MADLRQRDSLKDAGATSATAPARRQSGGRRARAARAAQMKQNRHVVQQQRRLDAAVTNMTGSVRQA